jgi:DNA-binding SARP family transcriptional activator
VEPREARRAQAADSAVALAELRLELGDPDGAARACRTGLAIDRYHDPLWRLLIEARDRAGDAGAALRARQDYESVLSNLGLAAPDQGAAQADGRRTTGHIDRAGSATEQAAPRR